MPVTLYKRQRELLDFIQDFIKKHGYGPTLEEMCKGLGVNAVSTIHEHVTVMIKKGVLRRNPNNVRGIEVTAPYNVVYNTDRTAGVELPLLGYVSAGKPLEPYEDPTATFRVSANLVPPGQVAFVLRVKGNSMIDDGILSGDYAVLTKDEDIKDGDVVVALLNNGLATLKKIFREEHQVKLMPANSNMPPIYAPDVQVQGKLCAIVRRYF
ncbi:transcriptional repressor LexA [Candidatus Gottesmanbacteria bacterium]|nr:transcriptional repressor LexA [Candidatus Gottesmanbacteria bacterium]